MEEKEYMHLTSANKQGHNFQCATEQPVIYLQQLSSISTCRASVIIISVESVVSVCLSVR